MRPAEGGPAHHYHLQVYALDKMLNLPHGASRAELPDAMRGHVVWAGEIVGNLQAIVPAPFGDRAGPSKAR